MAIVHARVDERLIHGQVAMVWTNTVGASRIIVVNNTAVKDEMMIAGLKMAKPAGVKLSILSVKRAIEKFAENAYNGEKVFLITQNIQDMVSLIEAEVPFTSFNVGNVAKRDGSRPIKRSVNLTEQDISDIKRVVEAGITVTAQMLPNESDLHILFYLNE